MTAAIFPGSFDPITLGHIDLLSRASMSELFDEIVVAIGTNTQKKYMLSLDERIKYVEASLRDSVYKSKSKLSVESYSHQGLLGDYMKARADKGKYLKPLKQVIIRGTRSNIDYEYEMQISHFNEQHFSFQTIIIATDPKYNNVSSSIVREILANKDFQDERALRNRLHCYITQYVTRQLIGPCKSHLFQDAWDNECCICGDIV